MIYTAFLIIFALFAISRNYNQYKRERVSFYWLISWTIFWFVVIAVALAPQSTDIIAEFVGVEKGADLIVYTAVTLLSYALYRVLVRQEQLQRELTGLVRQIAILEAKKQKKK